MALRLFSDVKFKLVILLISVLYSLNFLFWNVDLVDNFYWINRTSFYQMDFMNILSDFVCKLWLAIFGKTVLALRILGWLFYAGAMTLVYVCLQTKDQMRNNLYFLACGFVFLATGTQRMFTPDSPTVFCLAIASVCLVKYYQRQYSYLYYCLAVIGVLATSFRFPNILLFPFGIALAVFYDIYSNRISIKVILRRVILSIVLFGVLYSFLVMLLSGRTDLLAFALDGVLKHKVGPSHNLEHLISMYKSTYFWQLSNCANLFLMFYVVKRIIHVTRQKWISILAAPIIIIVLIKHSVYTAEIYPSFWGLWAILCILLLEYKSKEVADKMAYVSFIMLSFISIAGSDCGIMKLMPYCAAVTPICLCWNRKVGGQNTCVSYMMTILLLASIVINMLDMRKYSAKLDNPCLLYLRIDENKKNDYQIILKDIKQYGNEGNNIYYGMRYGHTMYALTHCVPQYYSSFWMFKDDYSELSTVTGLMKDNPKMVLFDFTKSNSDFFKNHGLAVVAKTKYSNVYKTKK